MTPFHAFALPSIAKGLTTMLLCPGLCSAHNGYTCRYIHTVCNPTTALDSHGCCQAQGKGSAQAPVLLPAASASPLLV